MEKKALRKDKPLRKKKKKKLLEVDFGLFSCQAGINPFKDCVIFPV